MNSLKSFCPASSIENNLFKVKEFAEIMTLNTRSVRRDCQKGKYPHEIYVSEKGEQSYQRIIEKLPEKIQNIFWVKKIELELKKTGHDTLPVGSTGTTNNLPLNYDTSSQEQGLLHNFPVPAVDFLSEEEKRKKGIALYHSTPSYNRTRADKKIQFINQFGTSLKGREFDEAASLWNQQNAGNPDMQMSVRTVRNAIKAYKEGHVGALIASYGANRTKTTVRDDWFNHFKSLYLVEGRPSLHSCWIQVLGQEAIQNPEINVKDFPKPDCFKRRLDKEICAGTQYFYRYGQAKWNRKYGNYVDRDYSKLKAGELWVSDHRQTDIVVMHNGKPVRAWATVWSDVKTRKILSCFLHPEAPNSDHIFQSFYQAVLKYGLPEAILLDNGKDYRCKDFAGGRTSHKVNVDEVKTRSMLNLIGVSVHFALPYRAQTKPIERIFRDLITGFEVHLTGYCGGNIVEKPEKLKNEIKKGEIYDFEVFKANLNDYIENVYNNMPSQGKALQGKSPNQAWAEDFTVKRYISKEELKLFCMRTSNDVTIGKNGAKDTKLNVHYYSEWMLGDKGRKVYIRRDIDNPMEAWIYDAQTDEFIGNAEIGGKVDVLAKDEISKLKLSEAISRDRADIKFNKSLKPAKKGDIGQILENQKAAAKVLSGEVKEANPDVIKYSNTKMTGDIKKAKKLKQEGTAKVIPAPEKPVKSGLQFFNQTDKNIAKMREKRINAL